MPRMIRDTGLETRTARSRLARRVKPYFRLIEPGLFVGYRKLANGPGTWVAKRYSGKGRYRVENLRTADGALVIADDYSNADGQHVLNFAQAQGLALADANAQRQHGPSNRTAATYTVADAMEDDFRFLENDGRSEHAIADARYRAKVSILPTLGNLKVSTLTTEALRKWRDDLVKRRPRLRTREGEEQKYREIALSNEDVRRARRATANRIWTALRATLNFAFKEGKVASDIAWRRVKPYRGVERARVRYLSIAEAKRLINACNREFRPVLQAALQTGGRYGQLVRLVASDFDPDAGTVRMRTRKGDGSEKVYQVHLTPEGRAFFAAACAGRGDGELIFTKANGSAWDKSEQARPMKEASMHAKISPAANFHIARHTWASHSVMNGTPLLVVAKNLGRSDTRMVERHYGHLAPSYVAEEIRKGAPKFGFKTSVRALRWRLADA